MTGPDDTRSPSFGPDFLTELFLNPLDPGYADAAEHRARFGPPAGRSASRIRAVTVVTMVALGFLLVVAYRQTMAAEPTRTQARVALIEQVHRRRAETDLMQSRADDLRDQVAQLRERELGRPAAARLLNLEAATGLARVRGDGVTIALGDGDVTTDPVTGEHSSVGRVQDRDLQLVANALWAAGAEAIAINGQRLTATSTIRLAGEAILVDFRPVTSPYEVVAIGPAELEERVRDSHAARVFRQLVTEVGMSFDIKGADDVTLAAAAEPKLRFATPAIPAGDRAAGDPSVSSSSGFKSGRPSASPGAPTPAGEVSTDPSSTPSEGGR